MKRRVFTFVSWIPFAIYSWKNVASLQWLTIPLSDKDDETQPRKTLVMLRDTLSIKRCNYEIGSLVCYITPHDPTKMSVGRIIGMGNDRIHARKAGKSVCIPRGSCWIEPEFPGTDYDDWGLVHLGCLQGRILAHTNPKPHESPSKSDILPWWLKHGWIRVEKGLTVEQANRVEFSGSVLFTRHR